MRRLWGGLLGLVGASSLAACTASLGGSGSGGSGPTPHLVLPVDGYLAGIPTGETEKTRLCARGNQDAFALWWCAADRNVTGLEDLLEGLQLKDPANPTNMTFAANGHSTSLVTRFTTSLNPRVIIFTPAVAPPPVAGGAPFPTPGPGSGTTPAPTPGGTPTPAPPLPPFVAVGFARGNGMVEIAASDPASQDINFYLLRYFQGCEPNCGNYDLFTAATESGWKSITVYAHQDIHDTPLDCMACHQPGGEGTKRILRMQERQFPWTHWFPDTGVFGGGGVNNPPTGTTPAPTPAPGGGVADPPISGGSEALLSEFLAAHGTESYGGIPGGNLGLSQPFSLESLVESGGFAPQPNEFLTFQIEPEGRGPTWLGIYANAVAGLDISVPFYAIDPYDPTALADATNRYQAAQLAGPFADRSLAPDLTDLFPAGELGDLGFQAADSSTSGTMVVTHRCGFCHNGLFPGISRNNFDVHNFPAALTAGERQAILTRIRLPQDDPWRMPPRLFSDLTETQIRRIEKSLGATSP